MIFLAHNVIGSVELLLSPVARLLSAERLEILPAVQSISIKLASSLNVNFLQY